MMKFKKISKVFDGNYITRFDIEYETENGAQKTYEIVSRSSELSGFDDLHDNKTEAVVMIVHDKTGEKLLLNREYRMAVGEWVYNFPAGLIDEGESISEAARRELYEETGLDLTAVSEVWKESYSAVGMSNEKSVVVLGTAEGDIRSSDSDMEEIFAGWYTKSEVQSLLKEHRFAARTQVYCALWSRNQA